jgi:hypothetical protein
VALGITSSRPLSHLESVIHRCNLYFVSSRSTRTTKISADALFSSSSVGALAAKLGLNIYWLSLGSEECVRPASVSTSPSTSITSSSLSLRQEAEDPGAQQGVSKEPLLTRRRLNDSSLQSLLSSLPNRCILLIEDM